MDQNQIEQLLKRLQSGEATLDEVVAALGNPGIADLGHTRLDLDRSERCGFGEVVFGAGKSPRQLVDIARAQVESCGQLLITRASEEGSAAVLAAHPEAVHHRIASAVTVGLPAEDSGIGDLLVLSAGTSDGGVAREAALTARMLGARVQEIPDVGVAGLHRLLGELERLRRARALVVVAGMEGALPSVVGGLVSAPVVAVPTSVGYGANFGGVSALLGMLNSCAAGVTVVNIDNGFGAGYAAARINALGESK